jgi:acetate kinase
MRTLLASDEPRARLAVEFFVYRVAKEVAALGSSLGGLNAVVFTAGIGERSVEVRERICRRLSWLGIALDTDANVGGGPRISADGSSVSAWVIPTDEELMVAHHTLAALRARNTP